MTQGGVQHSPQKQMPPQHYQQMMGGHPMMMQHPPQQVHQSPPKTKSSRYKNENILCAVLALLKELEPNELELVKRDIEKRIN